MKVVGLDPVNAPPLSDQFVLTLKVAVPTWFPLTLRLMVTEAPCPALRLTSPVGAVVSTTAEDQALGKAGAS